MSKKLWCSFFGVQNDPEIFFGFSEKSRKNWKKCVFFEKKLMVSGPFSPKVVLPIIIINMIFLIRKKCQKKMVFVFWNFFFKMKIGHLFLSIFEFKKKVLETLKLSIFSISLNYFGEMESYALYFVRFCQIFTRFCQILSML